MRSGEMRSMMKSCLPPTADNNLNVGSTEAKNRVALAPLVKRLEDQARHHGQAASGEFLPQTIGVCRIIAIGAELGVAVPRLANLAHHPRPWRILGMVGVIDAPRNRGVGELDLHDAFASRSSRLRRKAKSSPGATQ